MSLSHRNNVNHLFPRRCSQLKRGNQSLRYEVRYRDGKGIESVFGWAGTPEGAQVMVDAIRKHPVWYWPRIVDRHLAKEPTS